MHTVLNFGEAVNASLLGGWFVVLFLSLSFSLPRSSSVFFVFRLAVLSQ